MRVKNLFTLINNASAHVNLKSIKQNTSPFELTNMQTKLSFKKKTTVNFLGNFKIILPLSFHFEYPTLLSLQIANYTYSVVLTPNFHV